MTVAMIPDLSAILGWGHSDLSVSACVNRTFQRRDSCWACWTFACYQELRVKWRELIFCLLEVHSLGLGRSLARSAPMQKALSLILTPHHHPHLPHPPLSLCLSAWQLSSSWHLSCRYWERCARRAAEAAIDLPPFSPHKLHIKEGGGGRRGKKNIVNLLQLTTLGTAKEYGEGTLTVWLVVGEGIVAHCCATTAKVDAPDAHISSGFPLFLRSEKLAHLHRPHPPNKKHRSEYL